MEQQASPVLWTQLVQHYTEALSNFEILCLESPTREKLRKFLFDNKIAFGVCFTAMFKFNTNIYTDETLQKFSDTCDDGMWNDNLVTLLAAVDPVRRSESIAGAISYRLTLLKLLFSVE